MFYIKDMTEKKIKHKKMKQKEKQPEKIRLLIGFQI